jgi:hypothetical protein
MNTGQENRVPGQERETWSVAKQSAAVLAAGAGLAAAGPAEAVVMYNNFPDVTVFDSIPDDGMPAVFLLDVNGDLVPDIGFYHYALVDGAVALALGGEDNAVKGLPKDDTYYAINPALRLDAGHSIDSSQDFYALAKLAVVYDSITQGLWLDGTGTGFLGVTFQIPDSGDPTTHFGWVGVAVDQTTLAMTLCDAGWESTPGAAIPAGAGRSEGTACGPATGIPAPASLVLLAAGAAGILALRRARRGATQAAGVTQAEK